MTWKMGTHLAWQHQGAGRQAWSGVAWSGVVEFGPHRSGGLDGWSGAGWHGWQCQCALPVHLVSHLFSLLFSQMMHLTSLSLSLIHAGTLYLIMYCMPFVFTTYTTPPTPVPHSSLACASLLYVLIGSPYPLLVCSSLPYTLCSSTMHVAHLILPAHHCLPQYFAHGTPMQVAFLPIFILHTFSPVLLFPLLYNLFAILPNLPTLIPHGLLSIHLLLPYSPTLVVP